ncbi:class I SAM-dependent methyltransferase [Nodosilinea sp. FACHB-13]|uniref:class I SAM-dependent methyltransferase n=1 Tax=Cyanophyceae TaxID=3028117 RepID=UPI0016838546|nr:class I SAM-dependent methyltransferase [Nodosilinea sp. FACHB-13]MBD2110010.1 class I SAM-dependent methyltransferase [Nodosilinea sp. FACHB-13]
MTSISFYDEQGDAYFQATVEVDMGELYAPFLSLLPDKAHILDAGCGAGRDTKAFLEKGHQVTAIDASIKLVELSSQFTGKSTQLMKFQDMNFGNVFDGIWACASLLHIPSHEIHMVLARFINALKMDGVLYISFKLGHGERQDGDRLFVDYNENSLQTLIGSFPELQVYRIWRSPNKGLGNQNLTWINALILKNFI